MILWNFSVSCGSTRDP